MGSFADRSRIRGDWRAISGGGSRERCDCLADYFCRSDSHCGRLPLSWSRQRDLEASRGPCLLVFWRISADTPRAGSSFPDSRAGCAVCNRRRTECGFVFQDASPAWIGVAADRWIGHVGIGRPDYAQWPSSSVWAIGILVGVSLMISGATRIAMTLAVRRAVISGVAPPTRLAA